MHRKHSYKDLFMGAVVGSTLGAMTALLFTTEKGKKLKKNLLHKMEEFQHIHHLPNLGSMKKMKSRIQRKLKTAIKSKLRGKKTRAR